MKNQGKEYKMDSVQKEKVESMIKLVYTRMMHVVEMVHGSIREMERVRPEGEKYTDTMQTAKMKGKVADYTMVWWLVGRM